MRLRTWLVVGALVGAGCWESGTEAPPLPAIPSPLADAGGRFRAPQRTTDAAAPAVAPKLIQYARTNLMGQTDTIDFGDLTRKLAPDHTLVVAMATRAQQPERVALGKASLTPDALVEVAGLYGSVWSIRIPAGATQRLDVTWARPLNRGILVWMEWAGLDEALLPASVRPAESNVIETNRLSGIAPGTTLLALAIADVPVGSPGVTFTRIQEARNEVLGMALAYTVADERTLYQTSFATDPPPSSWLTIVVRYGGVSSAPSAPSAPP